MCGEYCIINLLGSLSLNYWEVWGHNCIYQSVQSEYGEGNGNPLQYTCLENSMDWRAWWAAVHGVTQNWTQLKWLSMQACIEEGNSNPLQYFCLENPGVGEPGWLPSMGSHRIRHDWSDLVWITNIFFLLLIWPKSRPSECQIIFGGLAAYSCLTLQPHEL